MTSSTPKIDVRPDHWEIIRNILHRCVPNRVVIAFGSRATWLSKEYSDLDIAIMGSKPVSIETIANLENEFSESILPYKVDVIIWCRSGEEFRKAIMNHCVIIQGRDANFSRELQIVANEMNESHAGQMYRPEFSQRWRHRSFDSLIDWNYGVGHTGINNDCLGKPENETAESKSDRSKTSNFAGMGFIPNVSVERKSIKFCWHCKLDAQNDAFWRSNQGGLRSQSIFGTVEGDAVNQEYMVYLLSYLRPNFAAIAKKRRKEGLSTISKEELRRLMVGIPHPQEQASIVEILKPLSNKIRHLMKINRTVVELLGAVYEDWFVCFRPTKTIMRGGLEYLAPEVWKEFPRIVDNAEIPLGWRVGTLGDIAILRDRCIRKSICPEEFQYSELEQAAGDKLEFSGSDFGEECLGQAGENTNEMMFFEKLLAHSTVARLPQTDGIRSTDTLVLEARYVGWQAYILACMSSRKFLEFAHRTKSETFFPSTDWSVLKRYRTCVPNEELVCMFQDVCEPMLDKVANNLEEIAVLEELFQILLPKLVSGDVEVGVC